jgi:hypothetical protein
MASRTAGLFGSNPVGLKALSTQWQNHEAIQAMGAMTTLEYLNQIGNISGLREKSRRTRA